MDNDKINLLFGFIGAATGVFGAAFGIYQWIKSREVIIPILELNIGMTPMYKPETVAEKSILRRFIEKIIKAPESEYLTPGDYKASSLIFGASVDEGDIVSFNCPYILTNASNVPIRNVTLALEYHKKYVVKMGTEIKGERIEGNIAKVVHLKLVQPSKYWEREINTMSQMVQVSYNVSVIRPGEKIVIFDPMSFRKSSEDIELNTKEGAAKGLLNELKKDKKFCDCCVVDVIIKSESFTPIIKRIKLLWFEANSLKELIALAHNSITAFWGGKFPKAGIYLRNGLHGFSKRKRFMQDEYAEILFPELTSITLKGGSRYFYPENIDDFEANMMRQKMPAWNYYQLSGNADTDELIMKTTGFVKV